MESLWDEWVEVRCCCDARLLGWLPSSMVSKQGREMGVLIVPVRSEVGAAVWPTVESGGVIPDLRSVSFTLATCYVDSEPRLALKAPHLPIETLRRIPGFKEAAPDHEFMEQVRKRQLEQRS